MGQYLIPAIATVLVAIIEALATIDRKSARNDRKEIIAEQERVKKRASVRAQESRLSMKMMDAAIQLAIVSANALTNGTNNGNVKRAYDAAQKAQEEYRAFVESVAAEEVANV